MHNNFSTHASSRGSSCCIHKYKFISILSIAFLYGNIEILFNPIAMKMNTKLRREKNIGATAS